MLNIAIQLYTVREEAAKDLGYTLEQVKKAGYQGVEFAGYYDRTPAQIRELLANTGLKMVGSHVSWTSIQENFDGVLAYILENKAPYVTVPGLPKDAWDSYEKTLQTAHTLNDLAERAAKLGVPLSYHNHRWEFEAKYEGKTVHEIFLTEAPKLHIELDSGWSAAAGVDNASYIQKLGKRLDLIHIKDVGGEDKLTPVEIGTGFVNVPATLKAAEAVGVTWGVVEQDRMAKYPVFESIQVSMNYLKTVNQ